MPADRKKTGTRLQFRHRLIGLTGTNGAGKGEVAAYLMKKGYAYVSLSDEIREELRRRGEPITRDSLIAEGNAPRRSPSRISSASDTYAYPFFIR